MQNSLIALKLFLDELDVDPNIKTRDDRKRVQKAVYLGQLNKADLGYRFSWYLMGPYSTSLTKDYFTLAEHIDLGDESWKNKILKSEFRDRLQAIKPILKVPDDMSLDEESWLELIASYHYLRKVSGQTDEETEATIADQKPHIRDYTDRAKATLEAAGLI